MQCRLQRLSMDSRKLMLTSLKVVTRIYLDKYSNLHAQPVRLHTIQKLGPLSYAFIDGAQDHVSREHLAKNYFLSRMTGYLPLKKIWNFLAYLSMRTILGEQRKKHSRNLSIQKLGKPLTLPSSRTEKGNLKTSPLIMV